MSQISSIEEQDEFPLLRSEESLSSIRTPKKRTLYESLTDKGNLFCIITFILMILGIIMIAYEDVNAAGYKRVLFIHVPRYVLSFGLFGFAGGFTNWIAIQMLFYKIPFVYGSGIIPARYMEIRNTIKNVIMMNFFDKTYLQKYIMQKAESYLGGTKLDDMVNKAVESETFDKILDTKLVELGSHPAMATFAMMGLDPKSLKPMVKPFVSSLGQALAPLLADKLKSGNLIDIDILRKEVDKLMTTKLQDLTPKIVTGLLEAVLLPHLSWLVFWGCFFGGIIGIISQAADYGYPISYQ